MIAKSPDGDFSYTRDASGIWMAEPLNWEPEPEDY